MSSSHYSRDFWIILIASFFYASCATSVLPIIAGFAGSLGASAALMGMIGGMINFCSLFCRPVAGNQSADGGRWPHHDRCRLCTLIGVHFHMDVRSPSKE